MFFEKTIDELRVIFSYSRIEKEKRKTAVKIATHRNSTAEDVILVAHYIKNISLRLRVLTAAARMTSNFDNLHEIVLIANDPASGAVEQAVLGMERMILNDYMMKTILSNTFCYPQSFNNQVLKNMIDIYHPKWVVIWKLDLLNMNISHELRREVAEKIYRGVSRTDIKKKISDMYPGMY